MGTIVVMAFVRLFVYAYRLSEFLSDNYLDRIQLFGQLRNSWRMVGQ